jgi:hypothetical protein
MKTKIIILLTLLAVLATSCLKFERYVLTNVENQMIPYELGQVIGFIDSLGQPFAVTVAEDFILWWARDGREDLEDIEGRRVFLQSELGDFDIVLGIDGNYGNTNDKINIIVRPFNSISGFIYGFHFTLSFNKEGQFFTNTEYNDYKQYFYDSLEINNKIYYDVVDQIVYDCQTYYKYKEQLPVRLYYNKTYGILQFEDKDKVLFTINN